MRRPSGDPCLFRNGSFRVQFNTILYRLLRMKVLCMLLKANGFSDHQHLKQKRLAGHCRLYAQGRVFPTGAEERWTGEIDR